jgi:fumarate hydratase subunit beta
MRVLDTPLSRKEAAELRAGELVALTGTIFTARDRAYKRVGEKGVAGLPRGFKGGTIFHCGPIVRKRGDGWQVVAAGPTTSARMDGALPAFMRAAAPSMVIGKGGLSKEAAGILVKNGCPYLSMTGGVAALAASMVRRARGPFWRDLGDAEAVWEFDVVEFGPLVVAVDARGGNLFETAEAESEKAARRIMDDIA